MCNKIVFIFIFSFLNVLDKRKFIWIILKILRRKNYLLPKKNPKIVKSVCKNRFFLFCSKCHKNNLAKAKALPRNWKWALRVFHPYLLVPIPNKTRQLITDPPPISSTTLSNFKALALWADAFYKYMCSSMCLFVCLFTFEVTFKCLFAPTSQS